MNKKIILQRIFLISLIYAAVFILLAFIQFSGQRGFTREIESLTVTGYYRSARPEDPAFENDEHYLTGESSVIFGGMEFRLGAVNANEVFRIFRNSQTAETLLADRLSVQDNYISFIFKGGEELLFATGQTNGIPELIIQFDSPGEGDILELPFRPQSRTIIRNTGGGSFVAIAGGMSYNFINSAPQGRLLVLKSGESICYRAIPYNINPDPANFIISRVWNKKEYEAALKDWRSLNYSYWSRTIAQQNDETAVITYVGESIGQSMFKNAVSTIPAAFLNGNRRTHESSVYLGRLETAFRFLLAQDKEKTGNLARLINDKSFDLFKETHVFEYLAVRGQKNLMDQGGEFILSIDSQDINLDIIPGIFEGFRDWEAFNSAENPFTHLVDAACNLVSGALRTNIKKDKVFVFQENQADAEYNLRLGKAILDWAESGKYGIWTALARSLILSVLSMEDNTGSINARLLFSPDGMINVDPSSALLPTARLYRVIKGEYSPRAIAIGEDNIWTWTAAQNVSADKEDNVLNIAVSFPEGETHYMIILGIMPFAKLQLYNTDIRSDPQYERLDSSGWNYIPSEQCLLVKMKHRTAVENIRIFY